jgi:hypothetical protein
MRFNPLKSLLIASVALASSGASASVVFMPGNHPQPGEQNIHFGGAMTGTTVTGTIASGEVFDFTSTTGQTLMSSGSGQAHITTNDNGGLLTSIDVTSPGHTYTDFIANLMTLTSPATITVTANDGTFKDSLPAGNGSNFVTIVASNGETISSVEFTSSGFNSFRQPRVSGVDPIPEPSTWVLLALGFGGLGYAASGRGAKSRLRGTMA